MWGDKRPVDDDGGGSREYRLASQRDADRILYSSAFRRLSGVTQVVSRRDELVLHDRLVHSLKVAQVAHRLTQDLRQQLRHGHGDDHPMVERLDPDTAYMASLAHDLGHPPYGHAAEEELQKVLRSEIARDGSPRAGAQPYLVDSFEGNAQTFRIVTKLEARKDDTGQAGLNLAWRSLGAILKYPWTFGAEPQYPRKWGAYHSEAEYLELARERARALGLWRVRSIDAEIMDWADDIAYAVHDLEDFFRGGLVPLDRLSHNTDNEWHALTHGPLKERLRNRREQGGHQDWDDSVYEDVCSDVQTTFPDRPFSGLRKAHFDLHGFASDNIRTLSREAYIHPGEGRLAIPFRSWVRAELLKKVTREYVIDRPAVAVMQRGQRRIIRELFFDLYEVVNDVHAGRRTEAVLPERFRDYTQIALAEPPRDDYGVPAKLARATVDYITSLTDQQAALLHARITGEPTGSGYFEWLSV